MNRLLRVLGPSIVIIGVTFALWASTGREVFTRWPDEKLERADVPASDAELDLLADIGLETEPTPSNDIESRFAFGLLPSGGDPRHLASVALAAVVAIAVAILLHIRGRRSTGSTATTRETSS